MGPRLRKSSARLRRAVRRARPTRSASHGAPVSPLAPASGFPQIEPVAGLRLSALAAGVRYRGRPDVMLAVLDPGTTLAGIFTQSATRSAPVIDCQEKLGIADDGPAALLVNAGNANAFTGSAGADAVARLCIALSEATSVPEPRIFTASTGVIGERLPHDRIERAIAGLVKGLAPNGFHGAARAIMTTDTFPKGATQSVEIGGDVVRIAGIAKGSGMIAPDMATMLAYIFTDARIGRDDLQALLTRAAARSFNAITVDGDTSTSDTLMLAATGQSGPDLRPGTAEFGRFEEALTRVMGDLADQVVRDGEGATKFVRIAVTGAVDDADASRVARSVANSPLVKTALAGADPNWGRIVMAVGKSGARADRDRLSIHFGDLSVARDGWVDPDYCEADGARYMARDEIRISIDLGLGRGQFEIATCDLTHRYIAINADYRS